MKTKISLLVADDAEGDFYRAVWYLASALDLVGAGDRALSALQETFNQVLDERHPNGPQPLPVTTLPCRPPKTVRGRERDDC
jgi:hypothetical protein